MTQNMEILERNYNFTLSEDLNGPLLSFFVGLEALLSILANSFVLIATLCNTQVLKHPSNIFLTSFVIQNLFLSVFYLIPVAITAGAGQWVFGVTVEQKNASCQFMGCLYIINMSLVASTLTIISIDMFLFIVKPLLYRQFMKVRVAVALLICVWLSAVLLSVLPFTGLGTYHFALTVSTCVLTQPSEKYVYELVLMTLGLSYLTIIIVTNVWTSCYTRLFLKKAKRLVTQDNINQHHVYNTKIKKTIGIFSVLVGTTFLVYLPGVTVIISNIVTGDLLDFPDYIYATMHSIYYLTFILNPLIQLFFRKELKDFTIAVYHRLTYCLSVLKSQRSTFSSSLDWQSSPSVVTI